MKAVSIFYIHTIFMRKISILCQIYSNDYVRLIKLPLVMPAIGFSVV